MFVKHFYKKFAFFFLVLFFIFNFNVRYIFASEENSLNLNARSCIVLDRTSKKILYGKNEYNKVKMASTTNLMVTQTTFFKWVFFFTHYILNISCFT